MTKQTSGRSFHSVTFTDSEISFLKNVVTVALRDLNDFEKELKIAENEAWSNCNPSSDDLISVISFKDMNLIRDAKRKVQKRKNKLECIQRALRSSLNHSFK